MEICEEAPDRDGRAPAAAGYALSRLNPVRHGLTARSPLLPWEDAAELEALLDALVEEHRPAGPTERHLVGEVAAVIWRQLRVGQAEAAVVRDGLREQLEVWRAEKTAAAALAHVRHDGGGGGAAEAVRVTENGQAEELADLDRDERMTRKALRILGRGGRDAYGRALAALREDTRGWWRADAPGLRRFLEAEVLPWYEGRRLSTDAGH